MNRKKTNVLTEWAMNQSQVIQGVPLYIYIHIYISLLYFGLDSTLKARRTWGSSLSGTVLTLFITFPPFQINLFSYFPFFHSPFFTFFGCSLETSLTFCRAVQRKVEETYPTVNHLENQVSIMRRARLAKTRRRYLINRAGAPIFLCFLTIFTVKI